MAFKVKIINGHWTINKKRIRDWNIAEAMYFDKYILIHKHREISHLI